MNYPTSLSEFHPTTSWTNKLRRPILRFDTYDQLLSLFADSDIIRMCVLLVTVQSGGSGPVGRGKLTGWPWTESTYPLLLWDKKSFGKEFICRWALTSMILINISRDRHFWRGEFIDNFTIRLLIFISSLLIYYHWFHFELSFIDYGISVKDGRLITFFLLLKWLIQITTIQFIKVKGFECAVNLNILS